MAVPGSHGGRVVDDVAGVVCAGPVVTRVAVLLALELGLLAMEDVEVGSTVCVFRLGAALSRSVEETLFEMGLIELSSW